MMPRSKPKETIVQRVELGSWERQRLDGIVDAWIFNRVSTPVVAGMSDVSFMIVLGGILTLWFPEIVLPTGEAKAGEVIDAIKVGVQAGIDRAEEERAMTGEATLDDSTGGRDFLGRLYYNLTNPNWGIGDPDAPGVREALGDLLGR